MALNLTAAPGRQVSFSRRRFLQTYRHVAFALQLLSGVSTTSTFIRLCEQCHLPLVFVSLPILLFVVCLFTRFTPNRDVGVTAIVVGASTGAIAGFVSTVVDNSVAIPSPYAVPASRSNLAVVISSLEFLHIPVIVGAVMYTFCLMFTRLPPVTLVVLALATATCGTTILGIGLTLTYDSVFTSFGASVDTTPTFRISDWSMTLSITFVTIFGASLMPMLRRNKRAWIICFASLLVSTWWQRRYFDTLQWDWDMSYFPIPGALVGVVVLFMIDVVELTEAADVVGKRQSLQHLDVVDGGSVLVNEALFSAITWHILAYVVERLSLTMILANRRNRLKPGVVRRDETDVWLCCLGMMGLISSFSPQATNLFSLLARNVTICLALTLYVCISLISGTLANGYFIDDVLGLTLLVTTATTNFAAQ